MNKWEEEYIKQLSIMTNAQVLMEFTLKSQPDNMDDGIHSGIHWKKFMLCEKELRLRLATWLTQG